MRQGRLALGWLHLVEPKMIKKWKNFAARRFICGITFWSSNLHRHPFSRNLPDDGLRTKMLQLFSSDIILITPSSVRTSMSWSHFRITILNGTFNFRLLCSNMSRECAHQMHSKLISHIFLMGIYSKHWSICASCLTQTKLAPTPA